MQRSLILSSLLFFALGINSYAERMSVAFTGAEIRTAPSAIASKVILKVDKYYPLTIKKRGSEYYFVSDYHGRNGFIHKSLLKPQTAIIVTSDRANVRQGPGKNHAVTFQLVKGDSCRLLSTQENWLGIQTADGRKGWIAAFLTWGQ